MVEYNVPISMNETRSTIHVGTAYRIRITHGSSTSAPTMSYMDYADITVYKIKKIPD